MITINFTNRFFDHTINENNLNLNCHNLNLFIYIILKKYTLDKFYRIIINIKALKQLRAGYGQYFAYKK